MPVYSFWGPVSPQASLLDTPLFPCQPPPSPTVYMFPPATPTSPLCFSSFNPPPPPLPLMFRSVCCSLHHRVVAPTVPTVLHHNRPGNLS